MKKAKEIIAVIICAALALTYVLTAVVYIIRAFTAPSIDEYMEASDKKSKFVQGEVYYCDGPIYYMSHTVNGIPVAKQYFYVVYDHEDRAILLCDRKNYYKKFNDEGFNQNGVTIRGKARKIDSDMREDMVDLKKQIGEMYDVTGFGDDDILYIDNTGVFESFLRIVSMGMIVIPIIAMILFAGAMQLKDLPQGKKAVGTILILIMLGGLAIAMHSVSIWF